jgi:glutamate-1-semialdehyde 2,1-aminomutase
MADFSRSEQELARASEFMPGGVSSHFRLGIRPTPLVLDHGDGAHLVDVDGNDYIDYYLGMGPMILGHTPTVVAEAVADQVRRGILYAGQSEVEFRAAEMIRDAIPCAESIRFASSGSEAVHAGFRLARAATGRREVIKFEGHYHGWFDSVYWSVAPGANGGDRSHPRPVAQSLGQPEFASEGVVVLPWNDLDLLTERLSRKDVAAVFMEPFMFNTGGIPPVDGYLEGVRKACDETGTLLIFDEVITGFRVSPGGAQKEFGVTPDMTTLGKALANGFPVAALVGRREVMDLLADGKTVHGGTYNAQAVSMAATVATLTELAKPETYEKIAAVGGALMSGLREIFDNAGIPVDIVGYPAVFQVRYGAERPRDYREFAATDQKAYQDLAATLIERGVRILGRGTWFTSSAHTDEDVRRTLDIVAETVSAR